MNYYLFWAFMISILGLFLMFLTLAINDATRALNDIYNKLDEIKWRIKQ